MTHVLLTGPIKGTVTLQSGKEIDVRGAQIEVESIEEAQEVAHLIGERYAAEGHPSHDPGDPFVHEPHPDFANYEPHPANTTLQPAAPPAAVDNATPPAPPAPAVDTTPEA